MAPIDRLMFADSECTIIWANVLYVTIVSKLFLIPTSESFFYA